MPRSSLVLAPHPSSVARARAWLRDELGGDSAVLDDAELVASELVTNAIRAAAP